MNKILYDINQKGKKVTMKLYKFFEHLKFSFKAQKNNLKSSKILCNFFDYFSPVLNDIRRIISHDNI